jgi:hypothetical protein
MRRVDKTRFCQGYDESRKYMSSGRQGFLHNHGDMKILSESWSYWFLGWSEDGFKRHDSTEIQTSYDQHSQRLVLHKCVYK